MALRIVATRWLLAGGLIMAVSPALAQEGMLFKNLMEGVIGNKRDNDIEYRQRPPLVVPPGSALPRPQEPASTRNAAWPNDPDVARRRAERDQALVPATEREKYKDNQRPLLSQEELRKGRVAGRDGRNLPYLSTQESKTFDENIGPILQGRDLAARKNADDLANLNYGTEPERKYLYEPPVGYRMPAGTAPVGPGRGAPREDTQSSGQKEFVQGTPMPTLPALN
jgi:hypothetical protein